MAVVQCLEERVLLASTVEYRVNAGGSQLSGAPNWAADTQANPSPLHTTGGEVYSNSHAIDLSDESIPAGTPQAVFQSERWDPPSGNPLAWNFPVTPGDYEVRLYFAEIWTGAHSVGARTFDVSIEGEKVLDNYDVFATVGAWAGVVESFIVSSDSNLDVDFAHAVDNPSVKGIEILRLSEPVELSASDDSINLGTAGIGDTVEQTVELTHTGSAGDPDITIESTSLSGAGASQFSDSFDDDEPVTLSPGESYVLTVSYTAATAGATSAQLAITHDGTNSPLTIALSGTGEAAPQAKASVTINTGNQINSSTYTNGSFAIANQSAGGERITSVTFDLTTTLLPDMVFDPNGGAGDLVAKVFTVNNHTGVGSVSHSYLGSHDDGFDRLKVDFSDFAAGDTFSFSIDVDPTSIRGVAAPGPNETGSVSGLELTGATVTIQFNDGTTLVGQTFSVAGQLGMSKLVLQSELPAAPTLDVLNVAGLSAVVADAAQTIRVGGPVGADVSLMVMEGGLYTAGVPGGGFDLDAFEANKALGLTVKTATIGAGGFVDIAVNLTSSDADSGLNYIAAVLRDDDGNSGPLSPVAVLKWDPNVTENQPPVATDNTVSTTENSAYAFQASDFTFNDAEGDALSSVKITNPSLGGGTLKHSGGTTVSNGATLSAAQLATLVYTPPANATGSPLATFDFTVNDADTGTVSAEMEIDVLSQPTVQAVYRVNAGGSQLSGAPNWAADTQANPSPLHTTGGEVYSNSHAIDLSDESIPAGTPQAVFQSERWDPPSGNPLAWNFPVTPGDYEVRLYFAEIWTGAHSVGARTFDVSIEGEKVLDNYDVFATVGAWAGVVESFIVSSDSNLDVDFAHAVDNPSIKGIEIIALENEPPAATDNTVSTPEDNVYTFEVSDFTFNDAEGDPLASVKITNLSLGGGTLKHSGGTTVNNGATLSAAQLATLVYTPPVNASGSPLATFDFTVNDADPGTVAAQMEIDVTPVNDAPVALDNTVSTTAGSAYTLGVSDFPFSDVEGNALASVKITNLSLGGGTLKHSGGTTVSNGATLTAAQLATLVYTPLADATGSPLATFDFKVNDSSLGSVAAEMAIDVNPRPPAEVVYRVNAGGADLSGTPDWDADNEADPSAFHTTGSKKITSVTRAIDLSHSSIPEGTPQALFQTNRWDLASGSPMTWDFPVTPGDYEVRLYFAEIWSGGHVLGARTFDVSIEGVQVLDNYDIFAAAGPYAGVMESFLVTSDGNLDIDFAHVVNNPAINAIEILSTTLAANEPPVATANTVSTTEDNAYQFEVEDFTFTDGQGDALESVTISHLSLGGGTLKHSGGTTVQNGDTLSAAQLATLVYTPPANASGSPLATFDFTVNDADSGTVSAEMAVNVTAVNDAPVAQDSSVNTTAGEAYTFGVSDFPFSDVEGNALASVTITNLSLGGGTLKHSGGTSVSNGATLTAAQLGTLVYTPPANTSGAPLATFDFKVNDASAGVVSAQMEINVTAPLPPEVVYRVNAGGSQLSGTPAWTADTTAHPSPFYTTDSNKASSTAQTIDLSHSSIPEGTPAALFQTDRWDPASGNPMSWDFSVTPGEYEVRLYFAEIWSGGQDVGARLFDVSIEGVQMLDDYDVFATVGGFAGVVESFIVSSDSNLDIDFAHVADNPAIKGIEILALNGGGGDGGGGGGDVDENEPPAASDHTVSTDEGTAYTFQLSDFPFSDAEGDGLSSVTITNLNLAGGTLKHSGGTTVNNGNTLTAAQLATLVYTPPADASGSPLATFDFAVNDADPGVVTAEMEIDVIAEPEPEPPATEVAYRVNAGGGALSGTPGWSSDTSANPSPYFASGSNKVSTTTHAIDLSHSSIPAGTPQALFQTDRWDAAGGTPMTWDFPVTPGNYEVRLYFAEIWSGGHEVGAREFDVSIEGVKVLDDYDVYATVGAWTGVMESFVVTSDSNLDIDFAHVVQNPAIKGIEIINLAALPSELSVSRDDLSFVALPAGQSQERTLLLSHNGSAGAADIVIQSTSLSGPGAGQFSDSFNDGSPITLSPGESYVLTVTYTSTSSGGAVAQLEIVHDGDNSPLVIDLDTSAMPVGFGKGALSGTSSSKPTSLQFGPDGRLYVAQQNGLIKIYDVVRNGANDYSVTETETITSVQKLPNHNDDGTPNPSIKTRLVTGLLVVGTAEHPILFVGSSDPRIGAGPSGTDLNLDTNSGVISRLTWNGSSWDQLELVRGLPRSEENHANNGMQYDAATNTLYVAHGGNTNMGATSNNFANVPEFALSAAILSIDLDAIGETTYDLPTLDDEDRAGINDLNDPFGGNDGKNQAKLVPGGPVQVYAPGFRNSYDIVLTPDGRMYTVDNGPNGGWGDVPVNEGPGGNATNGVNEPGVTYGDSLHFITGPGYYGGHPNPTRSNPANTFNASNPQSPVSVGNPIESDYRIPGVQNGALVVFPGSTNGLVMYTADNFGGVMNGNLLAASFDNTIKRVELNYAGDTALSHENLFNSVGIVPLDVTALGDDGPFPGTIWVADIATGAIYVFEPNDYAGSGGGSGDPNDLDGDGYSNVDEEANGTNPNSSADVPADWDEDFTSNLLDADDDNDSLPDIDDPFAIDPSNGQDTPIGTLFTWENDEPERGGLLGLGFTGLMTNGTANYEDLYDIADLTAGGAAGVLTVDAASEGTARGGSNSQEQAFQFGFDVSDADEPFTGRTRVAAPFAGLTAQDGQEVGFYLGTGDQDNYVQLAVTGNDGGTIEFSGEIDGELEWLVEIDLTLPGPEAVDLFLTVDPDASTVQASYAVMSGGSFGPRQNLGGAFEIPSSWLTDVMAIGVISTSDGAAPTFPATWDFLGVVLESDITDP